MLGQSSKEVDRPIRPILNEQRLENWRTNREEFDSKAIRLRSSPLVLFVELTQNCNLGCPMCRQRRPFSRDFNMPFPLYKRIADELFQRALLIDLRGHGESMVLADFTRFAEIAAGSGAVLRLVTNGQINQEAAWDTLMSVQATVVLSCDAADPQLFAALRRGGTLDRLERTAQSIVKYRDKHSAPKKSVSLLAVVSRDNLRDIANLPALAARLGIMKVSLFPIQAARNDPRHLLSTIEQVKRSLDAVREQAALHGVEVHLGAAMDSGLAIPEALMQCCIHPWTHAYIDYIGRVGFCDHLIGSPQFTFGSISNNEFSKVWNNNLFQGVRAAHGSRHLTGACSPCRWCYDQRYVDFEDVIYPELAANKVSTDRCNVLYRLDASVPKAPMPFVHG
jgi:radical SAM protein with 4Fe4S-binding SPASM domain